jgi:hypothetical protein
MSHELERIQQFFSRDVVGYQAILVVYLDQIHYIPQEMSILIDLLLWLK